MTAITMAPVFGGCVAGFCIMGGTIRFAPQFGQKTVPSGETNLHLLQTAM